MQITQASLTDLEQIVAIERAGFTPEEAGSRQAFIDRINHFPETFLVAKVRDTVLGFICGPALVGDVIEDWMYEPGVKSASHPSSVMVLSLAVAPANRSQGIGSQLLTALSKVATNLGCRQLTLTCLVDRIPFYERNGNQNHGVATSTHANEVWYNMIKPL